MSPVLYSKYDPAGHENRHADFPTPPVALPLGHSTQEVIPLTALYVFAEHSEQVADDDAANAVENLPAEHRVQTDSPAIT
jgi:hypothetical protein